MQQPPQPDRQIISPLYPKGKTQFIWHSDKTPLKYNAYSDVGNHTLQMHNIAMQTLEVSTPSIKIAYDIGFINK